MSNSNGSLKLVSGCFLEDFGEAQAIPGGRERIGSIEERRERRDRRERASRDEFQRSIRVRHKRKATPEASSSLGAAASWRTARDPSHAGDFVTKIDYASSSFMG